MSVPAVRLKVDISRIPLLVIYVLAILLKCTTSISFPSFRAPPMAPSPLSSHFSLKVSISKQVKGITAVDPLKRIPFFISKLQQPQSNSTKDSTINIPNKNNTKTAKEKDDTKVRIIDEDTDNRKGFISDYDAAILNQYMNYKTGKLPPISLSKRIESFTTNVQNQWKSSLQFYRDKITKTVLKSKSITNNKNTTTSSSATTNSKSITSSSVALSGNSNTATQPTPMYWHYTGVVRNPQTGKEIAGIEGVESAVRLSSSQVQEVVTSLTTCKSKSMSKDNNAVNDKKTKSSSASRATVSTPTTVGYLSKKVFVYTDKQNHSQPLTEFRITPVAPRRSVKPVSVINEIVLLTPLIKNKSKESDSEESRASSSSPVMVSATILWPQGRTLSNHRLSISPSTFSSSSSYSSSLLSSPWQKVTRLFSAVNTGKNGNANSLEIVNYMRGGTPTNNNNNNNSFQMAGSSDNGNNKKKKMKWLSFASPLSDRSGRSQEYYTLTALNGAASSSSCSGKGGSLNNNNNNNNNNNKNNNNVSSSSKADRESIQSNNRVSNISNSRNNNSTKISQQQSSRQKISLQRPQPRRQQQHQHKHHPPQQPQRIELPSHECRYRRFGESPAWYAVGHSHSCVTELVALRHTSTQYFPLSIKKLFIELCTPDVVSEDKKTSSTTSSVGGIQTRYINSPIPSPISPPKSSITSNNKRMNKDNDESSSTRTSLLLQDFNTYCYDPYKAYKPWYRKFF